MPFPTGWPPRVPSGLRSIRFFLQGLTGGDFDSHAYLFSGQSAANPYTPLPVVRPGGDVSSPDYPGAVDIGANPAGTGQRGDDPEPMIWSSHILVKNAGTTELQISFDGTNVHGAIPAASEQLYSDRYEAGLALRGGGAIAVGSITTIVVANLIDGETFTVDDGVNTPIVFEFDDNGVYTAGNIPVDISAIATANDVRDAIIIAVNGVGATLLMTATNGGAATVTLTQDFGGTHGNTTQTETVADGGFAITNMAGGGNAAFHVEAW